MTVREGSAPLRRFVAVVAAAIFSVLAASAHGQRFFDQKLVDPLGAARARFGSSISADADVLVVGAPEDPEFGNGSVSVFRRISGGYELEQRLASPNLPKDARFGEAVAVQGDRLAVGASLDDGTVPGAGAVHLFQFDGASWQFEQKIVEPVGRAGTYFGYSLALDGDRIAVGSPFDYLRSAIGSLATFTYDGTTWNFEQRLQEPYSLFAVSFALRGEHLIVGSTSELAFAYSFDGVQWGQLQTLIGPPNGSFGYSVAMDGDTALVAATWADEVDVERRTVHGWTLEQRVPAGPGEQNDRFGAAVALCRETMVLGDPYHDPVSGSIDRGACFVYRPLGASASGGGHRRGWSRVAKLVADDARDGDFLGTTVATDGEWIFAGAPGEDSVGVDAGAVYVGFLPRGSR